MRLRYFEYRTVATSQRNLSVLYLYEGGEFWHITKCQDCGKGFESTNLIITLMIIAMNGTLYVHIVGKLKACKQMAKNRYRNRKISFSQREIIY